MTRALRLAGVALFAVMLAACAAPRTRPGAATSAQLAQQAARERELAALTTWTLEGRLGVSRPGDSGSGSLEWSQQGTRYRFSVHAPVTGRTWTLSGDAEHARLDGLREQTVEGDDAASLLERELGWNLPVARLVDWVRGARAPGAARITFRADGLPARIEQDGWTVEYLDYDSARDPPLPTRIFARRGDDRVRLAVRTWSPP